MRGNITIFVLAAAGAARDYLVSSDDSALSGPTGVRLGFPSHLASTRIQCDEKAVRRRPVDHVQADGDVLAACAVHDVLSRVAFVRPDDFPGSSVTGFDKAPGCLQIHNAIVNQWDAFLLARTLRDRPRGLELRDVR